MSNTAKTICREVQECGTWLKVRGGRIAVGTEKKLPVQLTYRILAHADEVRAYLTYDQEEAMRLLREALCYVNEHYTEGVDNPRDGALYLTIEWAMASRDMWAFRKALRRWVVSWLAAIEKAKGVV